LAAVGFLLEGFEEGILEHVGGGIVVVVGKMISSGGEGPWTTPSCTAFRSGSRRQQRKQLLLRSNRGCVC